MTSPGDFSNNWDISDSQVSRALPSHFLASTGDNLVSPILDSSTHADPSLTGRKLNSFIPIFELLGPKFVLDQDAYYIHGVVDDDDLAILWDYSSMVTELVLDSDVENGKPNIAPSTFIHLAQLLKPDSPLLPSLSHLRIIQAETSFPYLHLLHTPSLKALEATNVPEHQHPSFFSFLTTLVHKTPLLENIILGPGLFPSRSLQTILKFTHLHQLELRDAASTIDFTFFQGVGALPNLESFILDTRSCNYIARIPQKPSNSQTGEKTPKLSSDIDTEGISRDVCSPIYEDDGKTLNSSSGIGIDGRSQNAYSPYPSSPIYENNKEVSFQSPKLSSSDVDHDGPSWAVYPFSSRPRSPTPNISKDEEVHHPLPTNYDKFSCDTASPTSAPGGFYPLKKFHFVGGLPLIQDLISYIASSTLENISITHIHPSVEVLKQAEIDVENMMKVEAEERRREADQETKQRIMAITKSRNRPSLERRAILREAEEQEALCQEIEERQKAERVQKRLNEIFDLHTASYITVLQTVSTRWLAGLKTVKLDRSDGSSQPLSTPPTLPEQVYGTLFYHPKIEILEFKRWKLDSVEDFLSSLKLSSLQNLKHLHLPIDNPESAVSLSGLLNIAEACPMLESLRCCINTLPPIPQYSIPAPTKALFHGLQTLFVVSNPTPLWDFDQLLLVARHIYLTFPRLQTIDTEDDPNAEPWLRVRGLVQMFHTIRADDVHRFS